MNSKFNCIQCNRRTEKFTATIEGPEGIFDGMLEYCHFCDIGFYQSSSNRIELVEMEKSDEVMNLHTLNSDKISLTQS